MKEERYLIPFTYENSMSEGKTLIFAPHPDDEVFGCGGAIIRHVQQGDELKVVIVTDGGLPLCHEHEATGKSYTEIRKKESREAAIILGCNEPEFLDYPDGSLVADEKLIQHLLEIIEHFQPENIYLPSESEIHPDHIALSLAGTEAVRRFNKSITLVYYEIGQMQQANLFLDISGIHEQLNRAMDCFESQLKVQDYKKQINALHTFRTYSLSKVVEFAEAYNLVKYKSLKKGDVRWQSISNNFHSQKINENENLKAPLISVIVRTMNRTVLSEALSSIAQQTYPNMEVIVVDAIGNDELELGEFCGKFPISLISKNKPLLRANAANVGLEAVKGSFFCFLDEDDLIDPDHISILHINFNRDDNVAVYSGIKVINQATNKELVLNSDFNLQKLRRENYIPIHAVLFHTKLISAGCKFDETFEIYEDWDFLLQATEIGPFFHVDKITGIYRVFNTSGAWHNPEMVKKFRIKMYSKWLKNIAAEEMLKFIDYLSNEREIEIQTLSGKLEEQDLNSKIIQQNSQIKNTEFENLKDELKTKQIALDHLKVMFEKEKENAGHKAVQDEMQREIQNLTKVIENQVLQFDQLQSSISWRITKPLRTIKAKIKHSGLGSFRKIKKIKNSLLFNNDFYLRNNPDVRIAKIDPAKHYLLYGGFEGRKPSPNFDSAFYLNQNQDVKASGLNPLLHYILYGKNEGRKVSFSKPEASIDNLDEVTQMNSSSHFPEVFDPLSYIEKTISI